MSLLKYSQEQETHYSTLLDSILYISNLKKEEENFLLLDS